MNLENFSDQLAQITDKLAHSLVSVEARGAYGVSGLVVGPDLVLTTNHTTERDQDIKINTGSRSVMASVHGRHASLNIALLHAKGLDLPAVTWKEEGKIGELVLAVGRPGMGDYGLSATLGVLSSQSTLRTRRGHKLALLQSDASTFPGISGGALLAANGQVLGLLRSDIMRGVVTAIPASALASAIEHLKQHGNQGKPYFGIATQVVKLPDGQSGLLVSHIEPGSPAQAAGMLVGDVILSFGDLRLRSSDDLLGQLTPERIGKTVTLELLRAGQVQHLDVVIGERQQKSN
jgi:S1-C subfamily serine protease